MNFEIKELQKEIDALKSDKQRIKDEWNVNRLAFEKQQFEIRKIERMQLIQRKLKSQ